MKFSMTAYFAFLQYTKNIFQVLPAISERCHVAVQPVGVVVVEPVVSEALVDGEANVVEAGHLHDVLAAVVVDGVVARVAHHLFRNFILLFSLDPIHKLVST
jgi:hydrogenase-4 membrane subunit HyfE